MSLIDQRTDKKVFRLRGDAFEQSLVNHEHPNEFLLPLEKRRPSVETSLSQFQQLADSWFQQIRRFKAHRETGFTFYFCADVYNICLVSVVAGHHPQPIYGGKPKRFDTVSAMLQQHAEDFEAVRYLEKNKRSVLKQLVSTEGNWRQVAKAVGIKPEYIRAFIFQNLDSSTLESQLGHAKTEKIRRQCVPTWDYAIHVHETAPMQGRLVLL